MRMIISGRNPYFFYIKKFVSLAQKFKQKTIFQVSPLIPYHREIHKQVLVAAVQSPVYQIPVRQTRETLKVNFLSEFMGRSRISFYRVTVFLQFDWSYLASQ